MLLRIVTLSLLLTPALAAAQSPYDWTYYGLPNGPSAPGVHRVVGHHKQPVPFYTPSPTPEFRGPRNPIRFGWFGRFTPSPRPHAPTVDVSAPNGR